MKPKNVALGAMCVVGALLMGNATLETVHIHSAREAVAFVLVAFVALMCFYGVIDNFLFSTEAWKRRMARRRRRRARR